MVFHETQILDALKMTAFQSLVKITKDSQNQIAFYKTQIDRNESEEKMIEDKSFNEYLNSINLELSIRNA